MKKLVRFITGLTVALASIAASQAQTSIFTYQGKLNDAAAAATGTYQMQFALFPGASTGSQIGPTLTFDGSSLPAVQVTNGIFTVQLDFGSSPFAAGADRFLEISVKHAADPGYTTLAPRQQLTSSPYSIRTISAGAADSLSSSCVGCVTDAQINDVDGSKVTGTVANATNAATANTANSATTSANADNATNLNNLPGSDYVLTTDSRLTDSRSPTAGSSFYIQNQTGSAQTGDFSLSGTGAANIFDATTQFNLNGNRILSTQGFSTFVGYNAGPLSTGLSNTFVGAFSGSTNSDGQSNTFVGINSGKLNDHGTSNAFFGADAGANNTESNNSFFGAAAGRANTTGSENTFFGALAGTVVTTASNNAFFGTFAGFNTVSNGNNSFFGAEAGFNSTGLRNSFFGAAAGNGNTSGNDNVGLGNGAGGDQYDRHQ